MLGIKIFIIGGFLLFLSHLYSYQTAELLAFAMIIAIESDKYDEL